MLNTEKEDMYAHILPFRYSVLGKKSKTYKYPVYLWEIKKYSQCDTVGYNGIPFIVIGNT